MWRLCKKIKVQEVDLVVYHFTKLISIFLCWTPKFVNNNIAKFLGWLAVKFCPKWRLDMAVANIQECLGVDNIKAKKIAEESLSRFGRMVVEVLRFPLLNKQKLDEEIIVDGLDNLETAYQKDNGVVMVTAHYGNWEILGAFVGLYGYPVFSIVRQQNQSGINRLLNEYRELVGQKIVYNRGENNHLQIVRMLKKKNIIGVLYDQDTNDIGVKLRIFGKECIVPDGAAALSRLNKAPIVPIFIHNKDDGKFTIKIYPSLVCNGKDDYGRVMQELINIMENEIVNDPSMWFWVHDRWKDGHQRFDPKYDENKHGHHP